MAGGGGGAALADLPSAGWEVEGGGALQAE